eukprot:3419399-Prymnesium_polylepis.1
MSDEEHLNPSFISTPSRLRSASRTRAGPQPTGLMFRPAAWRACAAERRTASLRPCLLYTSPSPRDAHES